MKNIKTIVTTILIITVVICLIPVITYVLKFSAYGLSNDTGSFGVFGDFIGGVLNPIIGFANLILLVVISYYIARVENNRQINEFRYKAYLDFSKELEKIVYPLASDKLYAVEQHVKEFNLNNGFLFNNRPDTETFNGLVHSLLQSIDTLLNKVEEMEETTQVVANVDFPMTRAKAKEFAAAFPPSKAPVDIAKADYDTKKNNILSFIQAVMIE